MTKLFDISSIQKIKKQQKIQIVIYVTICITMLTGIVLACIFVNQLQRVWAQIIATICAAVTGCYTLFFAREQIYNNRLLQIGKSSVEDTTTVVATITTCEKNITTYKFLPFHIVDAVTQNNEIKRLYLYKGTLRENAAYTLEISQNIICGYEEYYE